MDLRTQLEALRDNIQKLATHETLYRDSALGRLLNGWTLQLEAVLATVRETPAEDRAPATSNASKMLSDYADLLDLLARNLSVDAAQRVHRSFTVEQIRAEAHAARPAPPLDWQPIATAPKDGTPIRLKWEGTTVEAIGRWCPGKHWPRPYATDDWRDVKGDDVLLMPTHWFPDPPAAVPQAETE